VQYEEGAVRHRLTYRSGNYFYHSNRRRELQRFSANYASCYP
jgi:hypothetical protein